MLRNLCARDVICILATASEARPDLLLASLCFTFGSPLYDEGISMKNYRKVISGFAILGAVMVLTRWAKIWPTAAAQRGENRSAEPQPARQTGFFGVQAGPAGPATELLKLMGVNQPDFG